MLAAAEAAALHGLPNWDVLVWATARVNGMQTVLTEDGQDGRVIDGVQPVIGSRRALTSRSIAPTLLAAI
jgi:predicted nucleic acid-binding protein